MDLRRYAVGSEVLLNGGTHFRVWAPRRSKVAIVLEHADKKPTVVALTAEAGGYFSGHVAEAKAGNALPVSARTAEFHAFYPDPGFSPALSAARAAWAIAGGGPARFSLERSRLARRAARRPSHL